MLSIGGISFITVHQIAIKWLVIENCKSDCAISLIHGTRQSDATGIGCQMLDVNMSTCQDAKVSHSNMTWGMQFALNRGTGISFWQTRSFCSWEKMVFSDSNIEACFREKGWHGARIVKEFPGKKWSRQSINRLVKKIEDTGSTSRQSVWFSLRRTCLVRTIHSGK